MGNRKCALQANSCRRPKPTRTAGKIVINQSDIDTSSARKRGKKAGA